MISGWAWVDLELPHGVILLGVGFGFCLGAVGLPWVWVAFGLTVAWVLVSA